MTRSYNVGIASSVKTYLDENDWHYNFDKDNGVFRFNVNLPGNLKSLYSVIYVHENDYTTYTTSPISADKDSLGEVLEIAEFVCRANYGLRNGNFEFDFRDGELRYKTYTNCKGTAPSESMVEASICCGPAMFHRYGKGILQILFKDMSAEDAVNMCERCDDEDDEDDPEVPRMDGLLELLLGGSPLGQEEEADIIELN